MPAYQTLRRWYSDSSGTVQQGWITSNAGFHDGNLYQAGQIAGIIPFEDGYFTQQQLDDTMTLATKLMAPYGAVGTVDMFINVYKITRTGRAAVFRTDTDIFVYIPKTNTGSYSCACGDWATNFELLTSQALTGKFMPGRDISNIPFLQGFYDMFTMAVRDSLAALINAKMQELQPGWAPGQPTDVLIYFMGHSQGAIISVVASTYFHASGYPYGGAYLLADASSTDVGDHSLQDYFQAHAIWDRTFRIINGADIIAALPPDCYHVGRTIVMCPSDDIEMEDNPSWDYPACPELAYLLIDTTPFHALDFYQASILRSLTRQSTADFPPLIAAGSLYAQDLPLTSLCMLDSDCTQGCGTLTSADTCGSGYKCDNLDAFDSFTCVPKLGTGSLCKADGDCSSGHCLVAFCVECTQTSDCGSGQFCSISADLEIIYTCQSCSSDGTTCFWSQGCCSNNCHFTWGGPVC